MREIKFRGLATTYANTLFERCDWVCGGYYEEDNNDWIVDEGGTHYVVEPESIGQFTGLKDRNGKEVYEGDVVKVYDDEFDNTFIGEVKFGFRGTPAFEIYDKDDCTYCDEYLTLTNDDLQFTVIGNIYENPGLLEE